MGQLDGKVVIVTGAAQGMGRQHAIRCAAEGANVVITDIQVDKGRELLAEVGGNARFVEHDVTSEAGWDQAMGVALSEFGKLDGLINNAAIYQGTRPLQEETFERFELHIRINVLGTWWGVRKAIEPMQKAGGGSIVNISSIAGTRAMPGFSSYGTSKWAVRGLTKIAANDLGPLGIRVNSIHPGGIEGTGMFSAPTDAEREARLRAIPLRRHGKVDDISSLAVFLLSDQSSYITGVEHIIDGGSSL